MSEYPKCLYHDEKRPENQAVFREKVFSFVVNDEDEELKAIENGYRDTVVKKRGPKAKAKGSE